MAINGRLRGASGASITFDNSEHRWLCLPCAEYFDWPDVFKTKKGKEIRKCPYCGSTDLKPPTPRRV